MYHVFLQHFLVYIILQFIKKNEHFSNHTFIETSWNIVDYITFRYIIIQTSYIYPTYTIIIENINAFIDKMYNNLNIFNQTWIYNGI